MLIPQLKEGQEKKISAPELYPVTSGGMAGIFPTAREGERGHPLFQVVEPLPGRCVTWGVHTTSLQFPVTSCLHVCR